MSVSTPWGASGAPERLSVLIEKVDLFSLVEKYAGHGRTSGTTTTYSCPNPNHPDHSPSFTVSHSRNGKQLARCWSQCAWQGDALEFVKWQEGLDTGEAVRWIRNYLNLPASLFVSRSSTPSKPSRSVSPKYSAALDNSQRPTTERAAHFLERYLEFRSWPLSVVEKFSLEVVLDSSGQCRVRHSYFTPTSSGEWVVSYWQDRGTSLPKWLSPRKSTPALYNLRSLERDELSAVVICEGPADTITASLALEENEEIAVIGVPGVSAWRSEWAEYLEGLRIVVAADNDEAGHTLETAVSNSVGRKIKLVRPDSAHGDLTETAKHLGLDTVRSLLLSAINAEPKAEKRSLEDSVRLLLKVFPEAFAIEEGAA